MKQRKVLLTMFTILSIVGYGAFVFAAPLLGSGGFNPGETLDPDCDPGDTGYDCKVQGGWLLGGNTGTDGGVNNFIGTTDAQDFVIKTNGAEIARFGQSGNVALGSALGPYAAPVSSRRWFFGLWSRKSGNGSSFNCSWTSFTGSRYCFNFNWFRA